MIVLDKISIPEDELAELCRRYDVRELAFFGSVLGDNFRDDSDLDILVEFMPGTRRGLFEFFRLQDELEALFHRPVDLVPREGLKRLIRDQVLESAEVIYAS